jgi:hypothetical protein
MRKSRENDLGKHYQFFFVALSFRPNTSMGVTGRCGILFYARSTTTDMNRSAVGCTGTPIISSQDLSNINWFL